MPGFQLKRVIDAPVQTVWEELADFGGIYKWNPGVTDSRLTSDHSEGIGITRHCDLKPFGAIQERVTAWHPGERLTIQIFNADRLPLDNAVADFALVDLGDAHTEVMIDYSYDLKWWGRLLPKSILHSRLERGLGGLLAGLHRHVGSATA